jgi:hypothetical protein
LCWEDFLGAWSVLISSAIAVQIYANRMSRCRRFCVCYDCWFSLIASKILRQNTWAFMFLFFMQSIFFRTKFGWNGCDDDGGAGG